MKLPLSRFLQAALFALITGALVGCYYDPGPSYPNYPNYPGGGYGGNSQAYNKGVNYGRQDSRRGLSRQASRHWHVVPAASRETFAHGYNSGYNRGGGGGGGGGQQAYSQGRGYGARDAQQGLSRKASRHWHVVQPAYRESFAQGYNNGYNRNR